MIVNRKRSVSYAIHNNIIKVAIRTRPDGSSVMQFNGTRVYNELLMFITYNNPEILNTIIIIIINIIFCSHII